MTEEKHLTHEEYLDLFDRVKQVLPQEHCQKMQCLDELLDLGDEPQLRDRTHELLLTLAAIAKAKGEGFFHLVDGERNWFDEVVYHFKQSYLEANDKAEDWVAEYLNNMMW